MFRVLFFLILMCTALFSFAKSAYAIEIDKVLQQAVDKKLHLRKEWMNLVHYKQFLWRTRSEAKGPYFFLSPNGMHDPKAELLATLKGFFSAQKRVFDEDKFPSQSARCQFPARWEWLSRELDLKESDLPVQTCAEFDHFKNQVAAQSATLIFASYNINNPSSAFGHTLLRFNRNTYDSHQGKNISLLDVGVNYAANPWTTNPFLYGVLGLSGFFQGTFAAMPYYYKVREYNDFDSRDLWEYNLRLSKEELQRAVAHVWELGFTYFDYYFFTSNCSYHMLTLLDVAAPQLNLVERLSLQVIPADTIKVVWETEGLVHDVVYRPSIQKQYLERLSRLQTAEEKNTYAAFQKQWDLNQIPSALKDESKAKILDTAIDKYDMQYFQDLVQEGSPAKVLKNKMLVARSRLPSSPEVVIEAKEEDRPHISHDSMRLSYLHLLDPNGNQGYELTHRYALHDFADPLDGYPKTAKIEFFKFTVNGSYADNDFFIRNIDFLSVQTIKPISEMEKSLSWKMRVNLDRVVDERCTTDCLAAGVEGAVGYSFAIGTPRLLFYSLLLTNMRFSSQFVGENFTFEAGPQIGLRGIFTNSLVFHAESSWQWVVGIGEMIPVTDSKLRWSPSRDWAIDFGYRYQYFDQQYIAGVHYYF